MAVPTALKLGVVVMPAVAASLVLPSRQVAGPPSAAAQRAERQAATVGLVWGKLRAFCREEGAWRLTYQPTHGAWVVTVRVPDLGPPEDPALHAAPWLPGARLSAGAASRLVGGEQPLGFAELLARRDWWFSHRRVVGSLVVSAPPSPVGWVAPASWPLVGMVALLLAGAVGRRMRPQPPAPLLRRALLVSCALLLVAVPGASRLAWPLFAPGVRPFVSLLLFQALGVLLLASVAAASFLFPAFAGSPGWWSVAAGFSAGWFLGLLTAPSWAVAVAALPPRAVLLLAAPMVVGYLADLAASGARILLAPLGTLAPWAALIGAGVSLMAGEWGVVLTAVLVTAAWPPAKGFWFAVALAAGFLPGVWWGSVGWWGPLRDALVLGLTVWTGLALWATVGNGGAGATIAR